jgi:hypothetical protein
MRIFTYVIRTPNERVIIAILHFATAVSRLERIRRGRMADIRILLVDDWSNISAAALTQSGRNGILRCLKETT